MSFKNTIKSLGPGLLWAGAAIGVSHLVQSTRAGAIYGFQLVGIILLINLFKYPFFEYGPRYASATGESLLHGYKRLGKWALVLYLLLTVATMFTLQAAITAVTAGLFSFVFPNSFNTVTWAIIILTTATLIVALGKYSLLDKIIKFIIALLAFSTIVAVISASTKGFNPQAKFATTFNWNFGDIALLIAFAGWMPSAIDISVWHSFWSVAKSKQGKHIPSVKESIFDFNVGYIGTAVLSIGFLSLGALVMYGTENTFSENGTVFAGQLIHLFTTNLGSWAYIFIAVAALTTMSSTTLTCLDAYPRVLKPTTELLFPKLKKKDSDNWNWLSWMWLIVLLLGTILILLFFLKGMSFLVDLATTLSFLTAPVLGYLNFKVVMGKNVSEQHKPKRWLRVLSWLGLIVLTSAGIYYLIWKLFIL
ncbi:MAG: Nramp family divalent metal transporter [Bacteroidota bacterium]|nr:Nramp family divalent metal transporter [Bacteroidota bacterium]